MMRMVVLTGLVAAASALAQGQPSWSLMAQQNQLGLLQYCQALGHVPAELVERQRRVLAAPATAVEAVGRGGMIAYLEPQTSLAEAAAASGTTVGYRCALMAYRVPE